MTQYFRYASCEELFGPSYVDFEKIMGTEKHQGSDRASPWASTVALAPVANQEAYYGGVLPAER
jgi:hypothetical protein